MHLVVNAVASTVDDSITVADVVHQLAGPDPRGVAVALNGDVVPRSRWADTHPSDGDHVEVLTAVQGG
ncbi:sulfur carrier protein ThiS [Dactylosporangium sp. AC04546]|uniref:sulfur carrier protein ThiS n=1 Tax=Dactylosporangium sp. AC04546 TaxID=2862460 RepID=UPI001EDFFD97|nr:sulfur carrier protein ThiS [Dactylosporangium sp. AC04546]WVK89788.1 sulfur carrier protein ThiS [Dactylosporangium sp. AC04546]